MRSPSTAMRRATRNKLKTAVVVGGGVLGVEAAEALLQLGLRVTIVHRGARLMEQQIDKDTGEYLVRYLDRASISVSLGAAIAGFEGARAFRALRLENGTVIEADLFVACTGTQPNLDLAGLETATGIRVDGLMRTSDPEIFAIGDVAEFDAPPDGLWPTALSQAQTAASVSLGNPMPFIAQRGADGDIISAMVVSRYPGRHLFDALPEKSCFSARCP